MTLHVVDPYAAPVGLRLVAVESISPALMTVLANFLANAVEEGAVAKGGVNLEADETAFYLCTPDDVVVAAATCYSTTVGDVFLQFVYVVPEFRRRGCLTCLWRALEDLARVVQAQKVVSISKVENAPMAAFYAKARIRHAFNVFEVLTPAEGSQS